MSVHATGNVAADCTVTNDGLVVVQHHLRIFHQELHHTFCNKATLFLFEQSFAANKSAWLVKAYCKFQSGLYGCILISDIMAPVAVGLFDTKRIHCMHADVGKFQILAGLNQRLVDMCSHITRNQQLPAQFPNIRDTRRPNGRVTQLNLLRRSKRKCAIRKIIRTHLLKQRP